MKFLLSEHKDITASITAAGFNPDLFSFVKRRGKLHIQYLKQQPVFHFFRKKETTLDDEGQWREITHYLISHPTESKTSYDWNDVLNSFEQWLNALK